MTKAAYRRVYLRFTGVEAESMTIVAGSMAAGRQHGTGAIAESLHLDPQQKAGHSGTHL